jgi:hypothetical protein
MAVSLATLDHVVVYPKMLPQTAAKPPHIARQAENVPGRKSSRALRSLEIGMLMGVDAWGSSKGLRARVTASIDVYNLTKAA